MNCVYCGGETQVINSRLQKRLNQVWRRRKCLACGAIFSTHESAVYATTWRVQNSDGTMTPFDPHTLFLSLYKSLGHRPNATTDASALTDTIIAQLRTKDTTGLIDASEIIATTRRTLDNFDKVASVHYVAFHSTT